MIEKSIVCHQLKIAYQYQKGNSNSAKPTLIFVHGWLDNAASFTPLIQALPEYNCFAIDLPGHGLSDHIPVGCNYHFIDGMEHLLTIIKTLPIEAKPILIGHSLGGCLSSMIAPVCSDLLSACIFLDAIGPLVLAPKNSVNQFKKYLKYQPQINKRKHRFYKSVEQATQHRANQGYLAETHAKYIVERGLKSSSKGYLWRHDKRLLLPSSSRFTEAQVLAFLKEIDIPCCLISASEGFKVPSTVRNRRIKSVPKMEHYTTQGGHHFHLEKPKETAKLITEFIKRIVS